MSTPKAFRGTKQQVETATERRLARLGKPKGVQRPARRATDAVKRDVHAFEDNTPPAVVRAYARPPVLQVERPEVFRMSSTSAEELEAIRRVVGADKSYADTVRIRVRC
jgi:hypothetical protein